MILFKRGIHFFYAKLVAPKSLAEDDKRREFMLNVILLGSILLLLWSDLYIFRSILLKGNDYRGVSVLLFSFITLFFAGLYILSRTRHFVVASYGLIVFYFFSVSYASYHWGADVPTALLSFSLLIVVSSILINTRFSFIVTIATATVVTSLAYLDNKGIVEPATYWLNTKINIFDGIQYSIILLIIAIVSWLSNREIERSLRRARLSEAALKEQRDLLEITVEERTQQLQATQAEKIDQLYRFAEFGRLASGLFHDLMNPLTSVSLYLEQVSKTNPDQVEETQKYLQKAFEASKRIERFTQAVRKQLQHREAQELFSINEGVRQAVQLVAHKAWQAHVQISFHATEEIVTFDNPLKFHQVIVNLLSNAIDAYTDIPLSVDRKREAAITIHQQHSEISLIIQDWGAGIAKASQDKIFQPFYTTKSAQEGIGIGLSTTKQIIEKDFRGSISVDTQEGYGTTFRILFPQHEAKA
jgi:signal transduction histidine kinase